MGGAQHIMVARSQQFNEKPNYRFGVTKTVIGHIINPLPTISFAPDIVKVVSMHVRAIPVRIKLAAVNKG